VARDRKVVAPAGRLAGPHALPETLAPGSGDRLLVVAAHPDDDVLATGGLLQRAAASGAAVAVAFATDGENNPWAQRASERRLLVPAAARSRFGARRRGEALAALARLDIGAERARFLALPDQGLTRCLTDAPDGPLALLRGVLAEVRPTVLVGPSAADLHPDHSALAVLLRLALAGVGGAPPPRETAYLVHNPALRHLEVAAFRLDLDERERRRKRDAIACHATQLHLRGPWLRSFADGAEELVEVPWPAAAPHPLAADRLSGGDLRVGVTTRPRARSRGARTLLVVAETGGGVRSLSCPLPAFSRRVPVTDAASRAPAGVARFAGGPFRGQLTLPGELIAGARRVFLKLERRFGFFDEAGWVELAPHEPAGEAATSAP